MDKNTCMVISNIGIYWAIAKTIIDLYRINIDKIGKKNIILKQIKSS